MRSKCTWCELFMPGPLCLHFHFFARVWCVCCPAAKHSWNLWRTFLILKLNISRIQKCASLCSCDVLTSSRSIDKSCLNSNRIASSWKRIVGAIMKVPRVYPWAKTDYYYHNYLLTYIRMKCAPSLGILSFEAWLDALLEGALLTVSHLSDYVSHSSCRVLVTRVATAVTSRFQGLPLPSEGIWILLSWRQMKFRMHGAKRKAVTIRPVLHIACLA